MICCSNQRGDSTLYRAALILVAQLWRALSCCVIRSIVSDNLGERPKRSDRARPVRLSTTFLLPKSRKALSSNDAQVPPVGIKEKRSPLLIVFLSSSCFFFSPRFVCQVSVVCACTGASINIRLFSQDYGAPIPAVDNDGGSGGDDPLCCCCEKASPFRLSLSLSLAPLFYYLA